MVFGVYLRMGPPSETYPASYPTPTLTPSPAGHPNEQNTMWSTPSGYVKKYGHADGVIISSGGSGGMVDDGGFRMVCHPYVSHLLQGGSGVLVIHGRRCSGKSTTLWGWAPLLFKSLFEEIGKRPVGTYGVQVSQMDCCRDTITDVIAAARSGGAEGSYLSETTPSPDGSHLLSKRRSSKALRGGAAAGGGGRAPSQAAAVVHVMDVQGDGAAAGLGGGSSLLQGLTRHAVESAAQAMNLLGGGGIGGGGHCIISISVTHIGEGTTGTVHLVETSAPPSSPDVTALVEGLKAHATGAGGHQHAIPRHSLTKILHAEMCKAIHFVRVVLCTEPRYSMQALDLSSYLVGHQSVLVASDEHLPFEVTCALDAMRMEISMYQDTIRQHEYYRPPRRVDPIHSPVATKAKVVGPTSAAVNPQQPSLAQGAGTPPLLLPPPKVSAEHIMQLDAMLRQAKRDYAHLQEEFKAHIEATEVKVRRLSERNAKSREERDNITLQMGQLDARWEERWKIREAEFSAELANLWQSTQTVVDRVNEERRKAPTESAALLKSSRDRDTLLTACRDIERSAFQKQLDEALRQRDEATAEMKRMYESLLEAAHAKMQSAASSAARDEARHKQDLTLCKAEIEYLFEYGRALTRLIPSSTMTGCTLPVPQLDWRYLPHIKRVFKKVVMHLREQSKSSSSRGGGGSDLKEFFSMDNYPLSFISLACPGFDMEQVKKVLEEREWRGIL